MNSDLSLDVTFEDHEHATMEVAFLVEAFASTIDNVMGGTTGPIGRIAGRDMARKLPLHLVDPSLTETLAALSEHMKSGFDVTVCSMIGTVAESSVSTCFIRELCASSGKRPGGAACKLYHAYFDGIVNELMRRPVKSEILAVGDSCRMTTVFQ